jgi:protease-4
MKNFFKYLLATIVGVFLVQVIIFIIFIGMLAALSPSDKAEVIKPNSVLHLTFDYEIKERSSDNPFEDFSFGGSMETKEKIGLSDILKNLRKAARDENIKGIYLNLSSLQCGMATLEEIREAILKFKQSGKFVVCYSDYLSQSAYYLATAADSIFLNPEGEMEWKGLRSEVMFFKGTLEKLGVEPQVVRHGKFKSAIEPFTLEKMSDANREQTMTYVGSIWNHIVNKVSEIRGISTEELNIIADSLLISDAKDAKDKKMINGILYMDEFLAKLKTLSGTDKDYADLITIEKYNKVVVPNKEGMPKDKIAIVYAVGQIDMGKGDDETIGGDGLAETIRKVREDTTIKAMVLRVNSPGGSALASEIIWREVVLTKQRIPVIVSMGDLAASGGYYISCPADVVVANPTTLTGSIGVFGLLWNAEKMMNDKLGVSIDVVETNANAGIGTISRNMTPRERDYLQSSVEKVYDVFIGHVSEGRGITKAEVDSIGQGRVWSGINGKEIKLVDQLGGIETAIDIAKEKAGITGDARIIEYPEKLPFFEKLMKGLEQSSQNSVKEELGEAYPVYRAVKNITRMKGVQARMPFDINIY